MVLKSSVQRAVRSESRECADAFAKCRLLRYFVLEKLLILTHTSLYILNPVCSGTSTPPSILVPRCLAAAHAQNISCWLSATPEGRHYHCDECVSVISVL